MSSSEQERSEARASEVLEAAGFDAGLLVNSPIGRPVCAVTVAGDCLLWVTQEGDLWLCCLYASEWSTREGDPWLVGEALTEADLLECVAGFVSVAEVEGSRS